METSVLTPVPEKEYDRVIELSGLDLDYSVLNKPFRDLTKLAAKIAGTDISLISLIDSFTQWPVAYYGWHAGQIPRESSVCQFTIMGDEPLEIADLSSDARFRECDYVKKEPRLPYYCGIPLKTKSGMNIGTLSVMDRSVKKLSSEKKEMLALVAREIVNRLASLNKIGELQNKLDAEIAKRRGLSHDIRGPVGGIIGLSQIIKDQGDENKMEEVLELIEMIHDSGESIIDMADKILSVKNEDEKRPPKPHEFTLATLKDKLEQLYIPQATAKNVDLTIANYAVNQEIPFPKSKILQVAGNLISNAIHFTPRGGMVMVRQEFKLAASGEFLLFTIKDTGAGLSEEEISEFEEEKLPNAAGEDTEHSYGYSLLLIKYLVAEMGGEIEISSEAGKGSKLNVKLPLKKKNN